MNQGSVALCKPEYESYAIRQKMHGYRFLIDFIKQKYVTSSSCLEKPSPYIEIICLNYQNFAPHKHSILQSYAENNQHHWVRKILSYKALTSVDFPEPPAPKRRSFTTFAWTQPHSNQSPHQTHFTFRRVPTSLPSSVRRSASIEASFRCSAGLPGSVVLAQAPIKTVVSWKMPNVWLHNYCFWPIF